MAQPNGVKATDSLLGNLHAGSFRGATFFVTDSTTSGGRKQAQHDYPNSPKQSIEDLGFRPRNFKLSAIISGEGADYGADYLQKRDALLAALELAGEGTLSHPFFFNSLQVTARPYTLNEKMSELNKATIEMEFDISDPITNPVPVSTSVPQIATKTKGVMDSYGESIARQLHIDYTSNNAHDLHAAKSG